MSLYPWPLVQRHRVTLDFRRAVERARRAVGEAMEAGVANWRVGLSCGKDSTALALLLAEEGAAADVRAMSVKDDLDYPDEEAYLEALCARTSIDVDVIRPSIRLRDFLKNEQVSLVEDLHGRTAKLSAEHFYGLIDAYRVEQQYDGIMLGLRAKESRHRGMNYATRGTLYRKKSGETVSQPLATWSALDVHAYLCLHEQPLLAVYHCIDPGMDPFEIRKSWWVCGGGPARYGHYVWLRRWWPDLWSIAVDIDPNVRTLS